MSKVNELAAKVEQDQPLTEADRKTIAKIIRAFGQTYYTQTGVMFICGASSNEDKGLPETVSICPGFGADIWETGVYRKVERNEQSREETDQGNAGGTRSIEV